MKLKTLITILFCACLSAGATQVVFTFTNASTGLLDTNDFKIIPLGNTRNSDGSFINPGLPTRYHNPYGISTNWLTGPQYYQITNQFIGQSLWIRTVDASSNLVMAGDPSIWLGSANPFVELIINTNIGGSITNGGAPLGPGTGTSVRSINGTNYVDVVGTLTNNVTATNVMVAGSLQAATETIGPNGLSVSGGLLVDTLISTIGAGINGSGFTGPAPGITGIPPAAVTNGAGFWAANPSSGSTPNAATTNASSQIFSGTNQFGTVKSTNFVGNGAGLTNVLASSLVVTDSVAGHSVYSFVNSPDAGLVDQNGNELIWYAGGEFQFSGEYSSLSFQPSGEIDFGAGAVSSFLSLYPSGNANLFGNSLTNGNFAGTFTGNGRYLTNIQPAAVTNASGFWAAAPSSGGSTPNAATTNAVSQIFSGTNQFGTVASTNIIGNGAGLTNPATSLAGSGNFAGTNSPNWYTPTNNGSLVINSGASSAPLLGQLLSNSGWTSNDWSGSWSGGWSHALTNYIGSLQPLTFPITYSASSLYQIGYTNVNRTNGSVEIDFGGVTNTAISGSGATGPKAVTGALPLVITPTTNYDGTLIISIQAIGTLPATLLVNDSSASDSFDFRINSALLHNTWIGYGSGQRNTTGNYNTANGCDALLNNTTGNQNAANGYYALFNNTTGNYNTANGYNALLSNTTGGYNIANGCNALYNNTTGSYNTANGCSALLSNTTGNYNTANGYSALLSNTTGIYNTANGYNALFGNTTGNQNAANGYDALYGNTTGNNNTANGCSALLNNTTGGYNIANGGNALYSNTTGNNNTGNGYGALYSNTTGNYTTANGCYALYNNITGNYNTANGYDALFGNTTGNYNTANGYDALFGNTTGNYNTANGCNALYSNTTGIYNTANGGNALYSNTTGSYNTGNGYGALYSNTTGIYNTANGYYALYNNITGNYNTANGYDALFGNITGNYNTANGYDALYNSGFTLTNLSQCTFYGCNSTSTNQNLTDAIAIGYFAANNVNHTAVIGSSTTTNLYTPGQITAAGFAIGTPASAVYGITMVQVVVTNTSGPHGWTNFYSGGILTNAAAY